MKQFKGRLFAGRLYAGRLFRGPADEPQQPVVIYPGRGRSEQVKRKRDRDDDVLLFLLR